MGLAFKPLELDHHIRILRSPRMDRMLLTHGVPCPPLIHHKYLTLLTPMVLEIKSLLDQMTCKHPPHWEAVVLAGTIHFLCVQFPPLLWHNRVAIAAVGIVHIQGSLFLLLLLLPCPKRGQTSPWCKAFQLASKILHHRSLFHHHNIFPLPCNNRNHLCCMGMATRILGYMDMGSLKCQ